MLVQFLYLESGDGGGGIVYNLSVSWILFSVSNLLLCLEYVYAFMILLLVLISILSITFYIFVA